MPTVDLTLEQLIAATQQLTPAEFREFLGKLSDQSRRQLALQADEQTLRNVVRYEWSAAKQARLGRLLGKGNAGSLTTGERAELNRLVDEVEQRSLEKAEALHELLQRGIDLRPKGRRSRSRA